MIDASKIPTMREHRLKPRHDRLPAPPTDWDGVAYWTGAAHFAQAFIDGSCLVNEQILPPLILLQRRAHEIVEGALVRHRFDGDWREWSEVLDDVGRGHLELEGRTRDATIGLRSGIDWWISFREAGDPDSYGHAGAFMLPDFAYAYLIAVCQEHHLEQLAEDLRVGGLA